ncbi:putative arabinosyltransferase ARAD1 [Glycine soja]|uniref:Putative arabinosyltransferase ARAD1 n=1 Tax=Glycine soja TaxID=3848 RepID=A0A445KIC1_GLYSO|nr:putative arabinosyltransferase ARAD1 [Glycine soja]
MYDLSPGFHFGLLDWKGNVNQTWLNVNNPKHIPPYPGGLNLQHSVEYWLTLDLLSSNIAKKFWSCTAIRVQNSSHTDVVFVPFFSSLRHSKIHGKEKVSVNKMLQQRLVQFLMGREEWKRYGGMDHVIVEHHPNSILHARRKLGSAMLVLADFGRYPSQLANINKDIIAPYRHLVSTVPRAGHLKSWNILHDAKVSLEAELILNSNFVYKSMALSKFCLNVAGDTPSSNRLFDAIVSHCVPVIISDEIELRFEDVLDYSEFGLFVHASDSVRKGYLLNLLRSIKPEKWTKMWARLKDITQHFEYQYPSQPGDAVNMIWEEVAQEKQIPETLASCYDPLKY